MRRSIRFLLGGEPRELHDFDPQTTVLNYLREHEGLTGTKEGCAEGDCGACTIVVAALRDGHLEHKAVNACIQFLPMLDGKQLLAIEHLRDGDGHLHPAQQAMVDCHASQCGFCTPGFVMSLYALYRNGGAASRDEINDALAGNLCRCTGYGPIVDAAQKMMSYEAKTSIDATSVEKQLETIASVDGLALEHAAGRYYAPGDIDELAELCLAHPQATLLAGATDAGLWVTKQLRRLDPIIDLGGVAELKRLQAGDEDIEIGAMATYAEAHNLLARYWPDVGEVIRRLGSTQIRNAGTIGGNIANGSPIGDSPPILIALDATLVLRRGKEQRELPLEDYFIDYGRQDRRQGEFIYAIRLPLPRTNWHFRAYKISKRFDQDISAVLGAFHFHIADDQVLDARIAFGGMAGIPKRAAAAETVLRGSDWTSETIASTCRALADDFEPLTDHRASAGYRLTVAQNGLTKAYHEITAGAPSRVLAPPGEADG